MNSSWITVAGLVALGAFLWMNVLDSPSGSDSSRMPRAPQPQASQTSSAAPTYTADDFYWDDTTSPHRETIIAGVNQVARDNSQCRSLDPSSAYVSSSRGSESNPVFFVTCEGSNGTFNAFFSASDVRSGSSGAEQAHISRGAAIVACSEAAQDAATLPETVNTSTFSDVAFAQIGNGRSRLSTTFTAESRLGTEAEHSIVCMFDGDSLIEATVQ